jgi:hypothetical protein
MSSAVHTGFGHGCKRINKSRLDCLEHNDRITYIHCCKIVLMFYNGCVYETLPTQNLIE